MWLVIFFKYLSRDSSAGQVFYIRNEMTDKKIEAHNAQSLRNFLRKLAGSNILELRNCQASIKIWKYLEKSYMLLVFGQKYTIKA